MGRWFNENSEKRRRDEEQRHHVGYQALVFSLVRFLAHRPCRVILVEVAESPLRVSDRRDISRRILRTNAAPPCYPAVTQAPFEGSQGRSPRFGAKPADPLAKTWLAGYPSTNTDSRLVVLEFAFSSQRRWSFWSWWICIRTQMSFWRTFLLLVSEYVSG